MWSTVGKEKHQNRGVSLNCFDEEVLCDTFAYISRSLQNAVHPGAWRGAWLLSLKRTGKEQSSAPGTTKSTEASSGPNPCSIAILPEVTQRCTGPSDLCQHQTQACHLPYFNPVSSAVKLQLLTFLSNSYTFLKLPSFWMFHSNMIILSPDTPYFHFKLSVLLMFYFSSFCRNASSSSALFAFHLWLTDCISSPNFSLLLWSQASCGFLQPLAKQERLISPWIKTVIHRGHHFLGDQPVGGVDSSRSFQAAKTWKQHSIVRQHLEAASLLLAQGMGDKALNL